MNSSLPVSTENLSKLPYSAVLRIESKFDQKVFVGSGAMVGPYYGLTSVHNVYDSLSSTWARSVRAIPAQNGKEEVYGFAYVEKTHKFTDCGLALLVFDSPIGDKSKWFKMKCLKDENELQGQKLRIAGYPLRKGQQDSMYTNKGEIKKLDRSEFTYSIDTLPGQGGSPLWVEGSEEGENYVVGVHCTSGYTDDLNYGIMLTKDRLEQIEKWISEENKKRYKS